MTCDECGADIPRTWRYCRACGADLPETAAAGEPRLLPRISLPRIPLPAAMPAWLSLRGRSLPRPDVGRPSVPGVPSMPSMPAMPAMPRLGGRLLGLAALLVPAGVTVALVLTLGSLSETRSELEAAHDIIDLQAEQLVSVRGTLDVKEETTGALASDADALRAELADVRGQLEDLQRERDEVRTELANVEEQASTMTQQITERESRIEELGGEVEQYSHNMSVLTECLSGMEVALQFGRGGFWPSADRALDAVADQCAAARVLLAE